MQKLPARHIDHQSYTYRATQAVASWIVDDDPSKNLVMLVKQLLTVQAARLRDNVRMMSLYANTDFANMFGGTGENEPLDRICDNQIKKHTDTLVGKLIQSNSRIKMLTSQGDMTAWTKARKREQALEGEWARMGFFREAQKVCTDALNTGTGILKMHESDDGKRVEGYRVYPNEVFVDEAECANGKPTKMYQLRYVSRDTMAALYPDHAELIQRATSAPTPPVAWTLYNAQLIEVIEAWALPVGNRPGRHVITVASGALVDEPYTDTDFPFVIFKPYDMPTGWYGQGLACQVEQIQRHLNEVLETMRQGAKMGVAPYWVVAEGSNVNFKHLDNRVGTIVQFSGGEPKWITNPPFHQAAPVYCQMLRQEIADMYGNSQMDTGGDPTINRLDSKRALKEYQNIGASRITTLIERWSTDFFLQAARVTMRIALGIAKKRGKYPVIAQASLRKAVELDWKELDMDADSAVSRPAPVNLFSSSPAARLDQLTEMMQSGLITQKQAQRQMQGSRDVDAMLGESSATEDDLDDLIEGFVERGEYRDPSSYQNLQRGIVRVTDAYLQYRIRGLEADHLALFEQWLESAQEILLQMNSQQPTAPGAPLEPTPVPGASDLAGGPTGAIPAPPQVAPGAVAGPVIATAPAGAAPA